MRCMVKIFEKLPAGVPLTFSDVVEAENKILKAIKHSSLREWLTTVGCHHTDSYRHCLFVTGFAVAFAQHLGMREDDQRRLTRAALLHDVGKAFIPVAILDKPGKLTDEEMDEIRQHPRRGYDALAAQGGFPPEMLDVVLHHHEFLDGTGYPNGLQRQPDQRHRAADDDRRYLRRAGGEARLPAAVHPRQGVCDHGSRWAASSTSICCRRSARWRSGIDDRHSGMVRRTRRGCAISLRDSLKRCAIAHR